MKYGLKNKYIKYIGELPESYKFSESLKMIKIMLFKENSNMYKDLNECIKFINDDDYSIFNIQEKKELIIYFIANNIRFYEKANIEGLYYSITYEANENNYSKNKEDMIIIAARIKFIKNKEIYDKVKKYILPNTTLEKNNIIDNSEEFIDTLIKLGVNSKLANQITEELVTSSKIIKGSNEKKESIEIKEEYIDKTDYTDIEEYADNKLILKKYLNSKLEPLYLLNSEEIVYVKNLMKKIGFSDDIVKEVVIRNENFSKLIERTLTDEEREILNNAIKYKDGEYSTNYGINDTLIDINDILIELMHNFNEDNVELLKLLILELSDKLLNIESIIKYGYKPDFI